MKKKKMTNPVSEQDISKLNTLLNETLQQSDKQHLIQCVRILGTAVANLKIKYQVDEENFQHDFKKLLTSNQNKEEGQEDNTELLNQVFSKSIIECATAIAVAKKIKE